MVALEGRGPATPVVIGPLRVEVILKRGREGELAGKDRSSGGLREEAPEDRAGNPFKDPPELWMEGSQNPLTKPPRKGMGEW